MSTQSTSQYVEFDEYIEYQVEKARTQIRWTEILTAATGVGVLLLGYLFAFTLLDHWIIPGGFSPWARAIMLGLVALATIVWIVWRVVIPLTRTVNALFAARVLESAEPKLYNSLLTLLDLRRARRPVSDAIERSLEKRAAIRLSEMDVDQSVDRSLLLRLSYALLVLVILCSVYTVFSPKRISFLRPLSTAAAAVATRTEIVEVRPGNSEVVFGTAVEIQVDLRGEMPDEVYVVYSTDDRQIVDERIPMRSREVGLLQFEGLLDGPQGRGVETDLTYRVVAGDAVSPTYQLSVSRIPTAAIQQVKIQFPDYMNLPDRTQSEGSIDGWDGAQATVRAVADQDIAGGRIMFFMGLSDQRPVNELGMRVDGRELEATWTLDHADGLFPTYYAVTCRNDAGDETREPPRYPIHIRLDQKPDVFLDPAGQQQQPANAVIPVAVRAADPDFLLREVNLSIRQGNRERHRQRLFDGFTQPMVQNFPLTRKAIDLSPLELKSGDVITIVAEARDNKPKLGQVGHSQPLVIEITAPTTDEQRRQNFDDQRQQQDDRLNNSDEQPEQQPRDETPAENQDDQPDPAQPNQESADDQTADADSDGQGQGGSETGDSEAGTGGTSDANADDSDSPTEQTDQSENETSQNGNSDSDEAGDSDGTDDASSGPNSGDSQEKLDEDEALRQLIEDELKKQSDSQTADGERADESNTDDTNSGPPDGESDSTPDQQPSDDSPDGQSPEGQSPDGQSPEGQSPEGQTPEGQSPEGQSPEGQSPEGQSPEGQSPEGQSPEGQSPEGQSPEGQSPEGQSPEGQSPEGQSPEGQSPEGQSPEGQSPEGQSPEGQSPEGQSPDGQSPEGQSPEGQSPDGQSPDGQSPDGQSPDGQSPDGQSPTNQPDGPAPADARSQNPTGDPNTTGEANPDTQTSERPSASSAKSSPSDDQPRPSDNSNATNQTSPATTAGQEDSRNSPAGNPQDAAGSQPSKDGESGEQGAQGKGENGKTSGEGTPGSATGSQPGTGSDGSDPSSSPDSANANPEGGESPPAGQNAPNQNGMPNDDSAGGTEGSPSESDSANPAAQNQSGEDSQSESDAPGSAASNSDAPQTGSESGSQAASGAGSGSGTPGNDSGPPGAGNGQSQGEPEPGGSGNQASPPNTQTTPDEANLEYTKQAANLVLDRLEDQLERGEVDPQLLKKLGWTEAELNRFADRLRQRLAIDPGDKSLESEIERRQFEETLKSFEIRSPGQRQSDNFDRKSNRRSVNVRKLPTPARYQERYEAFTRSVEKNK